MAKNQPRDFHMLDIGCGNARELAFLYQNYPFIRPKGLDISEQAIRLGKVFEENGKLPKGALLRGDALEMPFQEASFDLIYTRLAFSLIPNVPSEDTGAIKVLRDMNRILKPGGHIEIGGLFGEGQDFLPFRQYYTRKDFERLLGFVPELELIDWQEPPVPNNAIHRIEERLIHYFLATLKKR